MPASLTEVPLESLTRQLCEWSRAILSEEAQEVVRRAQTLASFAHDGQKRRHGKPFLIHPVRVATILTDTMTSCTDSLIAAALLHDVLEDVPDRVTADEIRDLCGPYILSVVLALTAPPVHEFSDINLRNEEKLRRVLSGPSDAVYVKIADRSDNLIDACRIRGDEGRQFRARYLQETLEHYSPIVQSLSERRLAEYFEDALNMAATHVKVDNSISPP